MLSCSFPLANNPPTAFFTSHTAYVDAQVRTPVNIAMEARDVDNQNLTMVFTGPDSVTMTAFQNVSYTYTWLPQDTSPFNIRCVQLLIVMTSVDITYFGLWDS